MPLWAALLPSADAASSSRSIEDVLRGASIWALQFSPKVAVVEASAVLVELSASERLFGGRRRLVQRLREEASDLGLALPAWAPTSLAALAVARAGLRDGMSKPLQQVLDPQPLTSIAAVAAHEPMLVRLGCRTLKDVRALPRAGVARRFGAPLLAALDQAYWQRPDEHRWVALPETFDERLELLSRVEHAPAMLFGARRLLLQLCAWLAARRCGVTAFTLRWCHDVMRSRDAGDGGSLTVRTAQASRNVEHLSRLLAEHLERVQLAAPVGDLQLLADEVQALEEKSATLLPDPAQDGESLNLVLERIAARLGPEKVLRPVLAEDHRMHWMAHWQPAGERLARRQAPCPPDLPQPSFMLPTPLRLAAKGSRPLYQGPLLLLSGPHRVESGWWDRDRVDPSGHRGNEVRDYYVALSEHAGLLWVFQTRLDAESVESGRSAWFLAGVFA